MSNFEGNSFIPQQVLTQVFSSIERWSAAVACLQALTQRSFLGQTFASCQMLTGIEAEGWAGQMLFNDTVLWHLWGIKSRWGKKRRGAESRWLPLTEDGRSKGIHPTTTGSLRNQLHLLHSDSIYSPLDEASHEMNVTLHLMLWNFYSTLTLEFEKQIESYVKWT